MRRMIFGHMEVKALLPLSEHARCSLWYFWLKSFKVFSSERFLAETTEGNELEDRFAYLDHDMTIAL